MSHSQFYTQMDGNELSKFESLRVKIILKLNYN